MKSIFNSIVFGSTLVALTALLAACGDDDSEGSGASCAQVCAKVEAAKCKNDPDCMDTCNGIKDATPMGCSKSYNALANCYAGAKFECDDNEESVAKECSKQEAAYAECRQSGGKDDGDKDAGGGGSDSGDNGGSGGKNGGGNGGTGGDTGNSGSGASGSGGTSGGAGTSGGNSCSGVAVQGDCGKCLQSSCCDDLLACQQDDDCATLTECVGNCSDDSCVQTCADSASSSSVDLYNTFIDCATNKCETECSDGSAGASDAGSSGGDADVGAPNDGNGGHPSANTPTNCLPVSEGITGYCEEVKYKVIYDCPDGAPYDDCELNKVDASGIYCCGH